LIYVGDEGLQYELSCSFFGSLSFSYMMALSLTAIGYDGANHCFYLKLWHSKLNVVVDDYNVCCSFAS